ncbi:MAG: Glu/Leu/Phe/Val dehydrogenase dimerization domain-containing protein [Planctomycetia bacterium]
MSIHLLDAMSREGFEQVIAFHDRGSGARALLAIHDTVQGPAFGGIRRWSYASDEHALRDCLRLARAMTWKVALAGLRAGGAKLVLLERPAQDRERVYEALGGFIESLGGRYQAGPDVGTGDVELRALARRTQYLPVRARKAPESLRRPPRPACTTAWRRRCRHLTARSTGLGAPWWCRGWVPWGPNSPAGW